MDKKFTMTFNIADLMNIVKKVDDIEKKILEKFIAEKALNDELASAVDFSLENIKLAKISINKLLKMLTEKILKIESGLFEPDTDEIIKILNALQKYDRDDTPASFDAPSIFDIEPDDGQRNSTIQQQIEAASKL
jgi:hypothetical protein